MRAPLAPTAACAITAERVRITDVALPSAAVNDEDEAALHPPDGSAAFVAPGADAQHAKIVRVLPCE